MVTLYIGGLEPNTNEDQLRAWFAHYGAIAQTRLVTNDAGECRGFAYVTFESDLDAAKARVGLNGKEVEGQTLRVALAT